MASNNRNDALGPPISEGQERTPIAQTTNRADRQFLLLSWMLFQLPVAALCYLIYHLLAFWFGMSESAAVNWTLAIYLLPGFLTASLAASIGSGDYVARQEVKARLREAEERIHAQERAHERQMLLEERKAALEAQTRQVEAERHRSVNEIAERVRRLERLYARQADGTAERPQQYGNIPAAPEPYLRMLGEFLSGGPEGEGLYLATGDINEDWVDVATGRVKKQLPFSARGGWPADIKRRAVERLSNPPAGDQPLYVVEKDSSGRVIAYRWNVDVYPTLASAQHAVGEL
jgi:hypothetical protein